MKKFLFRDKAHSKWLILLIDCAIVFWALFLSIVLINTFSYAAAFKLQYFIYIMAYSVISVIVFVFFKIHNGIIRYSDTQDILRIFFAVLSASLISVCFLKFFSLSPEFHLKSLELILLMNFFISSSLLILLRIAVKSAFFFLSDLKSADQSEQILIYGTDRNAILIKKAIEPDQRFALNVVGFIDDDRDKVDKYIEQKRVYHSGSISVLKDKCKVSKILLVQDHSAEPHKKDIIEMCVRLGIKVMMVPPPNSWLYGKFNSTLLRDLKIEDLLERDPIKLNKENILKELSGKCILVTGAAGSIGSEIVRQALQYQPKSIILCDQAETPLHELQIELEDDLLTRNVKVFMANVQNSNRIRTLFELYRPEIVFHAAAYKHVPMMEDNPAEAILTNVLGTKNLADISIEFGVERFVMISTDKAVKPTNVMGASKRLAEMYIQSLNNLSATPGYENRQDFKTRFITTRFGNVLGSNGSVIPRFRTQIEKRGPVTVTHPEITRYFMTISEAVQLVMEAASMGKGGEIFLFDMGKPVKIVDLAFNMIRLAGLEPLKDINIVFTGLRPGEKLYEELLLKDEETIPTHHEKIKISNKIHHNYLYVSQIIKELILLNDERNDLLLVKKMKEVMPDYISNNSRFEELDFLMVN